MNREFRDSREGFTAAEEAEYNAYLDSLDEDDDEYEYTKLQDFYGDDWDHNQYDCDEY